MFNELKKNQNPLVSAYRELGISAVSLFQYKAVALHGIIFA